MGQYTCSPKLSANYHQLFSARFPEPECTAYSGIEGNEEWGSGDNERYGTHGESGKNEDVAVATKGYKRRKNYGQPTKWTVEKCQRNINNITLFFRKGTPLSNFYPCQFTDPEDNIEYNCSEQYYQAHKAKAFDDDESYTVIMNTTNQVEMKQQGEKISNFNQTEWRQSSRDVLLRACKLKFSQNEDLKRHLMNTLDVLAEASPTDCYWGIGRSMWDPSAAKQETWRGKNVMGNILMEVKEQLKKEYGSWKAEDVQVRA